MSETPTPTPTPRDAASAPAGPIGAEAVRAESAKGAAADETDADLLACMALRADDPAGASAAWAAFYRRHVSYVYAVCVRAFGSMLGGEAGAADLTAETFRRVYEHAGRFDDGGIDDADRRRRVRAKGITSSAGEYGDTFDGMLEHRAGRFHVYINTARVGPADGPRGRFTFAHELGHYFLDAHRLALADGKAPAHGSCCAYASQRLVEREADHFAANLLMPAGGPLAPARRS